MQVTASPQGFKEVMAWLQGDPSPVTAFELHLESMQLKAVVKPMIATMCASCIVQDEASRVTYIETVTTSMGQVALGYTHPAAQNTQLTIKDITDLPKEES